MFFFSSNDQNLQNCINKQLKLTIQTIPYLTQLILYFKTLMVHVYRTIFYTLIIVIEHS